jgi:hypothetical protein
LGGKMVANLVISVGIVLVVFLCFFIDGYLTFKRKNKIFSWVAFQKLVENGFEPELTGVASKFLFTDKRLTGYVEDYLVRVDGTRKILAILIGIDSSAISEQSRPGIIANLNSLRISINELFIEKQFKQAEIKQNTDLLGTIHDLIRLLKANNIQPEKKRAL